MGFRFSPSADGCQEVGRSVTTLACPLVAQWIQDHLLRSAQELLPWKKQTLRPHSGALSQKLYYNLDKQYCLQYPGSSNSPVALENTKKNLQRSSWPRMHGFAATHSKTHVRLRESCCAPPNSPPRGRAHRPNKGVCTQLRGNVYMHRTGAARTLGVGANTKSHWQPKRTRKRARGCLLTRPPKHNTQILSFIETIFWTHRDHKHK